ncbi:trafficking protein particle complex subunit 3-like [Tripterygium wilfordii]|uniref:trafficking protein particle complex subunit 3-like n=1 Tax=Tripterygium wilfordii TaxID=458696 RepID=UPI0018F80766|nr:trafficking protein particle complex subunit 3-like [Tripterygium wilfordii]
MYLCGIFVLLQFNKSCAIHFKKKNLVQLSYRNMDKIPTGSNNMSRVQVGFKMFLGVTAFVTNWDTDGTRCSIVFEDNPLVEFFELPDTCQGLNHCNILSGVIRGALEMVSMKTEVTWTRDMLRGDDTFELEVKLVKQIPEEYPYKDDE